MSLARELHDDMELGAYYALFKVVSVADLADAERAVEWARLAVEDKQLLQGFVELTRDKAGTLPRN